MRNRDCVAAAAVAALLLLRASAASALGLEAALDAGLERAPQIGAQKTLTDIARRDRWRRWMLNEPQATFASGDDGSSESYGLQLTVPFPGKTIAFASLDRARADAQEAEYAARRNDVARAVTQAYVDCATSRALFDILTMTSFDLEALARSITTLYETGHSTQAEKIGAELQLRQSRADLATAEDRVALSCRKLGDVLYERVAPATDGLPDDLDPARLGLGSLTPDEARAQGALAVAGAAHDVAAWQQAPDITFSAARNHYVFLPASPSGREWSTNYGVAVTLPIFFPFQESAEARRSKAQATVERATAELALRAAEADKADAAREYRRTRARRRELSEKDLILAQALVDSTMAAYRLGKLGFAEVLFSRKTLADLRTQDAQLKGATILAHLRCLDACDAAAAPAIPRGKE